MTHSKTNGCIVWQGKSVLDSSPIVLILTGLANPSHNQKTGNQIQSFIIRSNMLPTDALTSGQDAAVCGDCPLRRRSCYVNLIPINQVWQKYQAGGYPVLDSGILQKLKGRSLRVGSYGDPTAVPLEAWLPLLSICSSTGYTHQWRTCDQRWRKYLMASIEHDTDVETANSQGWRTFRVKLPGDPLLPNEIMCRNAVDNTIQCAECGLCNGAISKRSCNIANDVHGLKWKIDNFNQFRIDVP